MLKPFARLAVLSLVGLIAAGCSDQPQGPSVVLVTVDTLRADHLSAYGFERETSPHIDAFAATGVLFERAIATGSSTAPTHASILTSRTPREHTVGVFNALTRLEDPRPLAQLFRDAGYRTAAFVSNSVLERKFGFDAGFERYDDDFTRAELNRPDFYERIAGDTNNRAIEWLDEVGQEPFFLWVHYQDPHGPYQPPESDRGRFAFEPEPGEGALQQLAQNTGANGIPYYQQLPGVSQPSKYRGLYADEIHYMDRAVGALLERLDAQQPRAIVLLTADHGESMGEHGFFYQHGHGVTPELAHVPMILRAPGLGPQRRSELVSQLDVLPTLLELAGLQVPGDASGIALGPYLRSSRVLPERLLYCDLGVQLGVYGPHGVVLVAGLPDVWTDPGSIRSAPPPTWQPVAWGDVEPGPRPSEEVWRAIRAYYQSAAPVVEAAPRTPEDEDRLRALGYVDG